MIIWNGRGFVVAVIAFACLLLSEFLSERHFHDSAYYQQHGWPKLVAFLIAGVIVWRLSVHWGKTPARTLIEKETGKEVIMHRDDSLFFIPLRYWGPILCGLGIVFFLVKG
jgi:hypothetical protein